MTHPCPDALAARAAHYLLRRALTGAALLLLAAPFASRAQGVGIGAPTPPAASK